MGGFPPPSHRRKASHTSYRWPPTARAARPGRTASGRPPPPAPTPSPANLSGDHTPSAAGGGHSQYDPDVQHELLEATDRMYGRLSDGATAAAPVPLQTHV